MPLPSASKKVNLCALASEPTTAAVPKMPQLDKSTRMPAKSQRQPQKAKQPLRVPLAQATVQLSQRPLGRKSTAPAQTKVHSAKRSLGRRSQVVKAQTSRRSFGRSSTSKLSAKTRAHTQSLLASGTSCSVGEQPRKRASEGSGKTPNKTPLKMTKAGLSPCLNANSACVEQRSSPRSCQAKVERRTSLLASCSTPCSVMVGKSAPNSCDTVPDDTKRTLSPDRSSGSTPYHTAHSICLSSSSGGSVSPIGKVGRKFAGGTPFHIKQHSSFVSVTESPTEKACTDRMSLEDVSAQDELNDTFTLESPALSPKRQSSCSKKPPSSCLRKGTTTSHVKKSVSFTMPGRRSVTPKRLPKTPIRSRTLQWVISCLVCCMDYIVPQNCFVPFASFPVLPKLTHASHALYRAFIVSKHLYYKHFDFSSLSLFTGMKLSCYLKLQDWAIDPFIFFFLGLPYNYTYAASLWNIFSWQRWKPFYTRALQSPTHKLGVYFKSRCNIAILSALDILLGVLLSHFDIVYYCWVIEL